MDRSQRGEWRGRLWRDEARRTYDAAMSDLRDALERYTLAHSEQYERFLERKLAELRFYLHGA